MTDPHASIRKLLWLASHAGSPAEAQLAQERADSLAKKYKVDVTMPMEASSGAEVPPQAVTLGNRLISVRFSSSSAWVRETRHRLNFVSGPPRTVRGLLDLRRNSFPESLC
jgi:hypothetical protein